MSSKFGKIGVAQVNEDGSWTLLSADFESNNKAEAEKYIREALEIDDEQRLQIVRFYPEVYEVKTVSEPRRVVTATVSGRFSTVKADEDGLEEELEEDGDIAGTGEVQNMHDAV